MLLLLPTRTAAEKHTAVPRNQKPKIALNRSRYLLALPYNRPNGAGWGLWAHAPPSLDPSHMFATATLTQEPAFEVSPLSPKTKFLSIGQKVGSKLVSDTL